jgi:hypothetical protein
MADGEWKAKFQVGDLVFYVDDSEESVLNQEDIGIVVKRYVDATYKKWPVQKIEVLWLHTGDGFYDDADISCIDEDLFFTQDEWSEHIRNREQNA